MSFVHIENSTGQLIIQDGNESAGYVLTSDATGATYWAAAGGGGGAFTADGTMAAFQGASVDAGAGSNIGSFAQGSNATASGYQASFAQGKNATASGNNASFVQGYYVIASGYYGSLARGLNCTSTGRDGSFAAGRNCLASGSASSFAQGNGATASGNFGSFAQGHTVSASGVFGSFAQGYNAIASGNYGCFAQGYNATATQDKGCFAQGYNATANDPYGCFAQGVSVLSSGQEGSFAQGNTATASGNIGSFAQGVNVIASGSNGSFAQGRNCNASAASSWAVGWYAYANKRGQFTRASGRFAATGDAQYSTLIARNSTSNATQTELFLNGSSERITIATDTTWMFMVYVTARRTDADGESAAYEIKGCIDNNSGTTALAGSIVKNVINEDTAAWDVTAEADNTNDALVIKVTGEGSKTIRWVAKIDLIEVTG